MNTPADTQAATLRRLFLTLFLRGRSSRGLDKDRAPGSVLTKLWLTMGFYFLAGLLAFAFRKTSIFMLSATLHAMTFVFLGMFVAASGGEILFNTQESDILLHRPIPARVLLWAKARVLILVSLWLAGAFNLIGLGVGAFHPQGGVAFVFAHTFTVTLEALFCTGAVVLMYQLCLRWFGRERLEGLMTGAQVVVTIAAIAAGQIVPRLLGRLDGTLAIPAGSWWITLLPPVWFAALDEVLVGRGEPRTWMFAALGLLATGAVLTIAFGKLAADYERGLQMLTEGAAKGPRPGRVRRRWLPALVMAPPLRWWLRDPVARASFLLTAVYLVRDRDAKLRVYPGLASLLTIPVILFLNGGDPDLAFEIAFAAACLVLIPAVALEYVRYSSQWQAGDVFRVAPVRGPGPISDGARRAVLLLVMTPLVGVLALASWLLGAGPREMALAVPSLILLPLSALYPCLSGKVVPFSAATDQGKSLNGVLLAIALFLIAGAVAGLTYAAHRAGLLGWFILAEAVLAAGIYALMRRSLATAAWPVASE